MANVIKISTTVTETKSVEKDVELPYYFKENHGGYIYKVVSEKHAIQVCTWNDHLGACLMPNSMYKSKLAAGAPITEDEFDAAFSKAQMYVDLINRNEEPVNEEDPNVTIDRMIENKIAS